jgi:hypothetical protein
MSLTGKTFDDQTLPLNIEFGKGGGIGNGRVDRAETLQVVSGPVETGDSSLQLHFGRGLDSFQHFVKKRGRRSSRLKINGLLFR